MWLINCRTLKLEYFIGSNIPKYAILSHTWEEEEITFQEFKGLCPGDLPQSLPKTKGYIKIYETCLRAIDRGLEYAWVDTCCINKDSCAELTESINSMFQWYQNAAECYVFLSDLFSGIPAEPRLAACKWFTRGWTLQELIAPREVFFYNRSWSYLWTRTDFSRIISSITNINEEVLRGSSPWNYSVATRMSWAAHRKTTRTEDLAYCLLGIFRVNMPMIYGEGANAFLRLQEEIVKRSNDLTIFAWDWGQDTKGHSDLFALSPAGFEGSKGIAPVPRAWLDPVFAMTNKGLRIDNFKLLWKKPVADDKSRLETTYSIPLGSRGYNPSWIAMPLRKIGPNLFIRNGRLQTTTWRGGIGAATNFYLHAAPVTSIGFETLLRQEGVYFPRDKIQIEMVVPESHWDDAKSLFFSPLDDLSLVVAASGSITVGASSVQVVVCIEFHSNRLHSRIFNVETHSRLSSWLFRHRRFSHNVTWEDVRADEPEMLDFTDRVDVYADGTRYQISVSINKELVTSVSDYEINSVKFGVEKLKVKEDFFRSNDNAPFSRSI